MLPKAVHGTYRKKRQCGWRYSDGRTLITAAGIRNAVGFRDVASRREIAEVEAGGPTMSMSLALTARSAESYTGVQDQDKVVVISVRSAGVVKTFHAPKVPGPDWRCLRCAEKSPAVWQEE